MQPEDNELIIVTETEEGERLDKILSNRFHEIRSRTYFQFLIETNKVLVNGKPVKKCIKPRLGDEIEIEFLLAPELDIKPEPIPLNIIYEDKDIIAINKTIGMVVHPAAGNWTGTFVNALMHHCKSMFEDAEGIRPGIVHRLDKDTTGVLLAAKNPLAQQRLIDMFAARKVQKQYLAICVGNPGKTTIQSFIGRHPVHRKMMAVLEKGGREAITACCTQVYDGKLSIVEIDLGTGRTHQIRVHMKHHGTPILGDAMYGSSSANRKYNASRQMLHAWKLGFEHPITKQLMELEAPVPIDMQKQMEGIKKCAL